MEQQNELCTCNCTYNQSIPKRSQTVQKRFSLSRTQSSPFLKSQDHSQHMTHSFYKTSSGGSSNNPWSTYKQSWSKFTHTPKMNCSVGMNRKPLLAYDPNHSRNRLPVTLKIQKARLPHKNTFDNFSLIKNRTILKSTLQTMYQKSFKHPQILRRQKLRQQVIQ